MQKSPFNKQPTHQHACHCSSLGRLAAQQYLDQLSRVLVPYQSLKIGNLQLRLLIPVHAVIKGGGSRRRMRDEVQDGGVGDAIGKERAAGLELLLTVKGKTRACEVR